MLGYYTGSIAFTLLGTVVPGYHTFKALQDPQPSEQTSQWLTYWLIFAIFSCINGAMFDSCFDWIVPLWYEIKLLFVFWLQPTYFRGAKFLYDKLSPTLAAQAPLIDEYTAFVLDKCKSLSSEDLHGAYSWLESKSQELMGKVKGSPAAAPASKDDAKETQDDAPDEPEKKEASDPDTEVVDDFAPAEDKKHQ